jgi:hypothetical protein
MIAYRAERFRSCHREAREHPDAHANPGLKTSKLAKATLAGDPRKSDTIVASGLSRLRRSQLRGENRSTEEVGSAAIFGGANITKIEKEPSLVLGYGAVWRKEIASANRARSKWPRSEAASYLT